MSRHWDLQRLFCFSRLHDTTAESQDRLSEKECQMVEEVKGRIGRVGHISRRPAVLAQLLRTDALLPMTYAPPSPPRTARDRSRIVAGSEIGQAMLGDGGL
eukprot:6213109-Amphidinium_carterae.1